MNELEKKIGRVMLSEKFEIRVRNAGVFRFPPAYRFERHNHQELEVNYVNTGSCIMGIDGVFHPMKRGDCMIVSPWVPHQFIVDTRENCRITQLEFLLRMPEETDDNLTLFQANGSFQKLTDCEEISYFMENICRIFRLQKREENKEVLLHLGFFQLLLELSERIRQGNEKPERKGKAGKIADMIAYVNENSENSINMEAMADHFGVSSRSIRKVFQQETGMSCQKYIHMLRIGKAKELLWLTSKSVTEIALESGFGSSQYFCRVFQQYTDMTPVTYRNLWKGKKAEELCIDPLG